MLTPVVARSCELKSLELATPVPADERYVVFALSALPVGHRWRVRGIDEAHVTTLAASYGSLPPVVLARSDLTVVDGAHRIAAARRLGMHAIVAELFDGDVLDAFGEFVSRNATHGLALTPDDRSCGVLGVLAVEPAWSDRRVAQLCGVSPKQVARLRRVASPSCAGAGEKRIGRDGRARPVDPIAVRDRIVDALHDEPRASLRTIAQRLGVSPETVRRVRQRMVAAGADGLPGSDADPGERWRRVEPNVARASGGALWCSDNAFESTPDGLSFVAWFESTAVSTDRPPVDDVPLSRVYVVADEARRRARFWSDFADSLEQRTRARPAR